MTWETLIADHVPNGQTPLEARTYQHTYSSGSAPIRVTASDGNTYVVKGPRSERQAVNDQIIGRLGMALGAPVGEVTLVSVSEEFVRINDQLLLHYPLQQPYPHGVWHGSLFRAEFSDNRLLWEHCYPTRERIGICPSGHAVWMGWLSGRSSVSLQKGTASFGAVT
jgi:hypothetical protein